jgi:hypothetical protein
MITMPSFSLDLAQSDCFVSKNKENLKGSHLTSIDEIRNAKPREPKAIPKIEFDKCFGD